MRPYPAGWARVGGPGGRPGVGEARVDNPAYRDGKRELNARIGRNQEGIEGKLTRAGGPLVNDQGTALLEAEP